MNKNLLVLITALMLVVFVGCPDGTTVPVNGDLSFDIVMNGINYSCDSLTLIDGGYTIEATDGVMTFHMGFLVTKASPYMIGSGSYDWYFHVDDGDPLYLLYDDGQTFTFTYTDGVLNGTGSGNVSGTSSSGLGTVPFTIDFNIDINNL